MFSWASHEWLFLPQLERRGQQRNLMFISSIGLGLAILILTIWASWQRGPWLDEFWTLWLSMHDVPLSEVIAKRWLIDVHPPLFAFLNWLIEPLVGESILLRRLSNLMPFALLLCFASFVYRKYSNARSFIAVFMIMVVTSPVFAYNITEIRSYFTQICFFSALILCVYTILLSETSASVLDDIGLAVTTCFVIVICLNLHYVTAVTSASIVGIAGLYTLVRRQFAWFYLLAIVGIVAVVPLFAWYYAQTTFLDKTSNTFWINVGFFAALKTLAGQVLKSAGFNLVAVFALICTAASYFKGGYSIIGGHSSSITGLIPTFFRNKYSFIFAMVLALALGSMILLTINFKHPHLFVPRYLASIALMSVCIAAAFISDFVFRRPKFYVLLILNGLLVYSFTIVSRARDEGWDHAASLIKGQTANCGTAQVLAAEFPAKYHVINQTEVIDWAYRFMAHRFGFAVRFVDAGSRVESSLNGNCPTVLWVDHVNWSELPTSLTAELIVGKLNMRLPSDLYEASTLVRTGSGVLVVSRPPVSGN